MSRVGSTSKLAPDWLHKSEQPIRSLVSKLTQLLTMTTTHKFPPPAVTAGRTAVTAGLGRAPATAANKDGGAGQKSKRSLNLDTGNYLPGQLRNGGMALKTHGKLC